MTPAAYYGSSQVKQRIARENFEYFQGKGATAAAGANKADYQFNSCPELRTAYFCTATFK